MAAPESQDGVGPARGPEHAGLFEAVGDDRLAAGFDHTGANEQVLFAELGVVHASGVGGKVVGVIADLPGQFGIGGMNTTEAGDEFGDLAFVQPAFLMLADPLIAACGVVGKEQARQLPQVLAGVEEVDDLNGSGEVIFRDIPDPFRAIADNDFLSRARPATKRLPGVRRTTARPTPGWVPPVPDGRCPRFRLQTKQPATFPGYPHHFLL